MSDVPFFMPRMTTWPISEGQPNWTGWIFPEMR